MGRRRALAEALDSLEADATDVVLAALSPILRRVTRSLAGDLSGLTASAGSPPLIGLTAATVDELAQILTAWGVAVDDAVLPYFQGVYEAGGLAAVARLVELGVEPAAAGGVSPLMNEAAARHLAVARNRFLQVGDAAWRHARVTLLGGLEQGLGVDQIARDLRAVVDVSTAMARLIARTEVVSAANAGADKRMELEGSNAPPFKEWLSTLDSRTRPTHVTADGQVVERNALFQVGGHQLKYPGDPAGGPEEVYNCRCTVLYVETREGEGGVPGRQEGGVLEDADEALVAAGGWAIPSTIEMVSLLLAARAEQPNPALRHEPANVNADGSPHTGAMIALLPAAQDAERLKIDGGEDPGQLHVTLWFLGEADAIPGDLQAAILREAQTRARDSLAPLEASAFAANLFNPNSGDSDLPPAWVLGIGDGAQGALEQVRDEMRQAVAAAQAEAGDDGWAMPANHRPWVAHMTLAYGVDEEDASRLDDLTARLGPVRFDRIRVAYGSEVADFPLGGAVTAAAVSDEEATMPYGIRKGGEDCPFEVYNSDTDERAPGGCHPTNEEALRHQRALMRNVEDAAIERLTELEPQAGEHFHAVMHLEGVSTGRRTFTNLEWRSPPFAYHWQKGSSAHGGTPLTLQVGLVRRVVREENALHAFGPLDLDGADGREYARQLVAGFQRWVSIGLDEQPAEVEVIWPDTDDGGGEDESPLQQLFEEPEQVVIDGGTIAELTGTSIPAQADATVEPTPQLMRMLAGAVPPQFQKPGGEGEGEEEGCPPGQHRVGGECVPVGEDEEMAALAMTVGGLVIERAGDAVTIHGADGQRDLHGHPVHAGVDLAAVDNTPWKASEAMGRCNDAACYRSICAGERTSGEPGERQHWALPHHKTPGGPPNAGGVRAALASLGGARGSEPQGLKNAGAARRHLEAHMSAIQNAGLDADGYDREHDAEAFADAVQALTAAAYRIEIPDLPPAWWYDEPADVEVPGAFCVTDEGRVYGILAPLNTNHRAYATAGRRMTVPHGNVDYSRFLGAEALTASGRIAGVGPLTMDCRHASRFRVDGDVAPDHYENSCAVIGKIRVGETPEGLPWAAGALEPGVTPDQVSRMLACRMSGDWQPHPDRPGYSELVAALLVPSPGFPMGRTGPTVTHARGVLTASSVPVRYVAEPRRLSDEERRAEFRRAAVDAGSDDWALRARRFNRTTGGVPVKADG